MPKPKGPSDLRQRVKFQRRAEGTDAYGNAVADWRDLGIERFASLTPSRGGEDVQAGRIAGVVSWDCWVRSDGGTRSLNTGDRAIDLRDPRRAFNITFIGDMDGGRKWLLIQMQSGKADG